MSGNDGAPDVSVIVPCRDSTRTLGLQLEALSQQVDAPSFEVIIADNGSSDRLEEFLRSWPSKLRLSVVDASARPGAAYARNVGMSVARAGKLLFCDSDDVVARDWVACGDRALDAVDVFSGPGARIVDDAVGADLGALWDRLDAAIPPGEPVRPGDWTPWPIILGGNSGMRREVAWAVGGYDAALPGSVEDNDLAIRLQNAGYTIAAAPGVRILYRARTGTAQAFRSARRSGIAHVALCRRHDIVRRSPVLTGRQWVAEPLRVLGSGLKMLVRPDRRDVDGLAARAGLSVGIYTGWMRGILGRDRVIPAVAAGLCLQVSDEMLERPVLLLSPHLDDALFSASELVRRGRPDVWTVFAGEPEPAVVTEWDRACGFVDSRDALSTRRREDAAAFEGSPARIRQLGYLDGVYTTSERRHQDLASLVDDVAAWISEHEDDAPIIVLPAGAGVPVGNLHPTSTAAQRPLLAGAERGALAPMIAQARALKHRLYLWRRRRAQARGLAVNNDHLAVRDAVGDAFARDSRVTLALMEDLPYLWWHPGDMAAAVVAARWGRSSTVMANIVDREWKHQRIGRYESQIEVMDRDAGRLMRADSLPPAERLWILPPTDH